MHIFVSNQVSSQAYIFLCSVIGGALIGFIYDIFRIKRKAIRTNNIALYIEDFIYWIIVSLVMFGVVYYSNDGEIRGFTFLGTAIGVVLYILLLSKYVIKVALFIIRTVYRVLKVMWKVVAFPFKIVFKILRIPAGFLLKHMKKTYRKTRSIGRNQMSKAIIWGRVFKNIRKKI